MADEIRDANVVRLWRDPASGKWHGLLGPADGRGLVVEGRDAPEVLTYTAWEAVGKAWPFDPTAPGPVIDSGVKV
jgi:hypothetical protein